MHGDMETFDTFIENDMLEQIRVLEQVVMDNDIHAVKPLLGMYGSHACDQAVEEVMYHALQQLMLGSDVAVNLGLSHPSADIQILAMRCGRERGSVQFQSYLLDHLQKTKDPILLAEIIRSIATFADPELITVLLPYMHHDDSGVAGSCMDLLASLGGEKARDGLIELIQREINHFTDFGGCSFVAALGMGCLSRFTDDTTVEFLVKHIHHFSPTFRRLVGDTLITIGADAIPLLVDCVRTGKVDEKIMAANIIGFIRHRKGAELLIAELDSDYAVESNVRFAMYEAIGRIDCLRSALCLSNALTYEEDEFVVNAVLMGLDRICHPGLAKVFDDLATDEIWSRAMVRKLLALRSKNILKVIYDISLYRSILQHEVLTCGSKSLHRFCKVLFMGSGHLFPEALSDNKFGSALLPFAGRKIVVADDSKAVIRFYREVASGVGFEVVSAYDGKEALDYLQQEKFPETIDLLLTDMNMPNKDGVELVKDVREMVCFKELPILMATTESEAMQREVALRAGVSDFISKPFSRDILISRLYEMLSL